MARPGRPVRGGRGRREPDVAEAAPVMATQDMAPLTFAEPQRTPRAGGRARGGGGGGGGGGSYIGVLVPLAAGFTAAVITAIAGIVLSGGGKGAIAELGDQTAANAAILLASTEPDWWEREAGVQPVLHDLMKERYDEALKKLKRTDPSESDLIILEKDFKKALEKWDIQPSGDREATLSRTIVSANTTRLQKILSGALAGSTVLFAGIVKGEKQLVHSTGQQPQILGSMATKQVGVAQVTPVMVQSPTGGAIPGRIAEAPMKDRYGQLAGKVRLVLGEPPVDTGGGMAMAVVFALVALLLVGGATFGLCVGVSGGLKRVARDLDQIAQGDLDVRVAARGPGEVSSLSRAVDRAMKTFRAVQEQTVAAASAAQHVMVSPEVMDAATLLPAEPIKVDGFEVEAVHKPCPTKANDFFDYIRVDDEHVGVVIADMPQRGSRGAFIAATFRALLRAFAPGEASPAAVLAKVNRIMASELKRGDHIKAMYTVLDVPKSIVAVASAGHLPLIFWKLAKKGSALLSPEGIAIGLDKGPVFEKTVVDKRLKLEKGDRYVLHTDGPVAAKNMEGEEYGEQRFYYLVNREAPKNSAAFVNFVANEVDLFHAGAMQEDDITIVTVRKITD